MTIDTRPTRKEVKRGGIGNIRGWVFEVSYLPNGMTNFASAVYKTKTEAQKNLERYITTGKFDFYGSAEK